MKIWRSHRNTKDVAKYKTLLLAKQKELSAADRGGSLAPPAGDLEGDLMDRASADAEAELQIQLHQSDAHLERAIAEALARISRGAFGTCENCRKPISRARLDALPWTRLCCDCAEEQKPDSRERGPKTT
ncbi:MAG TPA: TraR/DksA C4-type zinc finger protein [Blastocatellia bacterium]|nr:TraR/DksA C4-type zinc finger protein [Blastocatellia bacterium]